MSTTQIAELCIKNIEVEEFVSLRNNKIKLLEKSIHETFRGKNVNPYIFNIFSEVPYTSEREKVASKYKIGYVKKYFFIIKKIFKLNLNFIRALMHTCFFF